MSFESFGLNAELMRAITSLGHAHPTPVQQQAIPIILEGHDLLVGAQTGTGKTAAFALPILHLLSAPTRSPGRDRPRALILTPTRELAAQVGDCVASYGKHGGLRACVVFGGVGFQPQARQLSQGVDVLVATPGRLLDHCAQGTLDLSAIEILVLDEADRMLDMGFKHDIRKIVNRLPKKRQNLLFSATYSKEIKSLSDEWFDHPRVIELAHRNAAADTVEQQVFNVDKARKRELLSHLIAAHGWQQVLVFTRTKHGANRLARQLQTDGIRAAAIHGNKSQNARTSALREFKSGAVRVLVATDVASRGLDIDALPQVVNFELPNTPEDYVHRIGRTGRAGSSGRALSLVCHEESDLLAGIEKLLRSRIPADSVEGFRPDPANRPAANSTAPRPQGRQAGQPSAARRPRSGRRRPEARRSA